MNREQCAERVNDALCIVQEALNDIKAALDCLGCAELHAEALRRIDYILSLGV
jgi:hypothetical protein